MPLRACHGRGSNVEHRHSKIGEVRLSGRLHSGVFGIIPRPGQPASDGPTFEKEHEAILDNAEFEEGTQIILV